jgi:hypothetical protein
LGFDLDKPVSFLVVVESATVKRIAVTRGPLLNKSTVAEVKSDFIRGQVRGLLLLAISSILAAVASGTT